MNKTVMRGVRTDAARLRKWDSLAKRLGVSRNQVFNLLIDNAVVVGEPEIDVSLNANTHSARTLPSERIAGVGR